MDLRVDGRATVLRKSQKRILKSPIDSSLVASRFIWLRLVSPSRACDLSSRKAQFAPNSILER